MNNFYDLNDIKKENVSTIILKEITNQSLYFYLMYLLVIELVFSKLLLTGGETKRITTVKNHIREERKKFGWKIAIMKLPKWLFYLTKRILIIFLKIC